MLNNQLASFAASGQLSKQKPKPKPTLVDVEIAGKTVEMEIPLQPNDPNFTKEIDKRARAIERDMFKKKIITKMVGASNIKGEELRKQAAARRAKGDIQGASDLLGQRANLLATGQDQKPQSDKVGSTSVVGNLPPVLGVPLTIASKALNTKEAKAVKKTVGDAFAKAGTASAVANLGAGAALGKMAGLAIQGAGKMTGRDIPVMASAAEQVVSKSVPLASREGVKMLNPLESSIVELASNPDQYLARIDQESNKAKQGDALSAVTYALLVGGPVLDVLGGVGGAASIVERLTAKIGKKATEKAAVMAARFAEQVPDIDALGAQFRPLKPGQSTRGVNVSFRQPARAAEPVPASVPDASPVETLARIANDEPVLALPARSQFSQEVDELRRVAEQPPVAPARAPEVVQPAPVAQVANDPIDTLARIASDEPIPTSQVSQPQPRPEPYTPTTPSNDKWETALDVAAQDYHWDFNKVRPEDERLLRALANREGFDLPPIDSEDFLYVWDDFRDTVQRRQYQSQIDPMDVSADVAKELAEVVRTRGKRNRFLEVRKNSQNLWRSTGGRQMSWIRLEDLPEEYHSRAIENARNYVDGKRFIAGDVYKSFISRGGGNRESVSIYNGDEVLFREISERGLTPDELSANASKVWIPKQAVVDIYENARSTIREKKAIGKSEATATRGDLLQAIEHYNPRTTTPANVPKATDKKVPPTVAPESAVKPKFVEDAQNIVNAFEKSSGVKKGRQRGSAIDPLESTKYLVAKAVVTAYDGTEKAVRVVRRLVKELGYGKDIERAALADLEKYRNQLGDMFDDRPAAPSRGAKVTPAKAVTEKPTPAQRQAPAKQGQAQAQKAVPEPGVNTGIKNAVQETEIEQGLIRSASPKFGKTQDQIKASIEGARGRTDYDQVAEQISKGESFNTNAFAVAMQGDRVKRSNIVAASNAHADAIARNAPQEEIDSLKRAFDAALDDRQAYLDKIQKGKSEWSNIGRTLAQEVEVDTGNVADVLQFAQAKKGSKLTSQEVDELRKLVDDTTKQKTEIEAKIAELETKIGQKDTEIATLKQQAEEAFSLTLREPKGRSTRQSPSVRARTRQEAIAVFKAANEKLAKAQLSKLGAAPDITAYAEYIKEIAPAVTTLVKSYIDEGIDVLDSVVRKVLDDFNKEGLPIKEDDILEIIAGKHTEQKPLAERTKTILRFRAEAKKIVDADVIKARKAEVEAKKIANAEARKKAQLEARKKTEAARAVQRAEMQAWRNQERAMKRAEMERIRNAIREGRQITNKERADYVRWWRTELRNISEAERAEFRAWQKEQRAQDRLNKQVGREYDKARRQQENADASDYIDWWKQKLDEQGVKTEREEYISWWNQQEPAKAEEIRRMVEGAKERTSRRIGELQGQLETGQFPEKRVRKSKEAEDADVELYRLRIKKKMLEDQVKAAIEAKKPQSGASKVGAILTEVKLANPASRILDVVSNIARATGYFGGNVPRSVMDAGIAKLTKGVQVESVITPERLRRIIARSKERAKMEFEMIRKSQDRDTLKKFGTIQGPFSKAAGMGDVPFRSIYFETAVDQGAEAMARKALGEKAPKAQVADFRDQIIRDLEQYPELEAAAHEFSLYMTYNGNNWVSDIGGYIKRVALRGNEPAGVVYDELIGRFGRVITNVATDQVNRTPVGAVRGLTKILKDPKVIDPKTRLEAIELIGKGLIGTAFAYLGLKAAEKIPGQVNGERQKYVDYGDLGKVGGPLGPFLLGATIGKAMKLSDSQRDPLIARSLLNMPFETPFASNIKDLLGVAGGAMDFRQFAARKITNTVIPGGVRDLAERTDVAPGSSLMEQLFNTGKSIEREKYPKEKTREFVRGKGMQNKEKTTNDFGKIIQGEFKSKIPGLRQQLPKKK